MPIGAANHHFGQIERLLQEVIEPLYGNVTQSLEKIRQGTDRCSELLFNGDTPVGLIIYKTRPTNEFAFLNIQNSLEIKTFCLIDPQNNSGHGFGTELLTRIERVASRLGANSIHVSVSPKSSASLAFFEKKGFVRVALLQSKLLADSKEFLLFKKVN